MNPAFYLFGLVAFIKRFDDNVIKLGWHLANRIFIKELNIGLNNQIDAFPVNSGILAFSNHPTGLDPYILSAVIPRDDVYILSDIYQTRKGENIAAHLIPVYYSSLFDALRRSGISFLGYLMMRFITGTKDSKEARFKNKIAINKAVEYVIKGHTVLIFPSGGEKKKIPWKKGIGEILVKLKKHKSDYLLVKFTLNELSENKLLWHFILGKNYLNHRKIAVSAKIIDNKFINSNLTAEEITRYLQKLKI